MDNKLKELYRKSYQLRIHAVDMVHHAKTGHAAPGLSMAEIIAALYFDILNIDPENPQWKKRDRFILSKGHACPLYYAALAERGYFPVEDLREYRMLNSKLQGHPDMKKCPGVDMTTGSLGNGFSAALGMALAARTSGSEHYIYAVTGDGELQEGIVWEAAMYAGNAHLHRLIVFVDYNGLQSGGSVDKIQDLSDLSKKFEAFGWQIQNVDGHDIAQIQKAVENAKEEKERPSLIIAHTVKGKGVSYMENQYLWHMKAPDDAQYEQALSELKEEMRQYE